MNAYVENTLHNKIKNHTASEHERLRAIIIGSDLFKNLNRYKKFILTQYYFHCDVQKLCIEHNINTLIPNIKCGERLKLLKRDLSDLLIIPKHNRFESAVISNRFEALGWLYVSEGSTLGAAIILKGVEEGYCLSEHFGARNLAAYPEGRAEYWNLFIKNLNSLQLNPEEEAALLNGALGAFKKFGLMLTSLDNIYSTYT